MLPIRCASTQSVLTAILAPPRILIKDTVFFPGPKMTNFQKTFTQLKSNLNTLREREAKYAGIAPLDLLNQISDHQQAIILTEQVIDGELTEAEWRETLKPLNIDHTLIEGGFFQKILKASPCPASNNGSFTIGRLCSSGCMTSGLTACWKTPCTMKC